MGVPVTDEEADEDEEGAADELDEALPDALGVPVEDVVAEPLVEPLGVAVNVADDVDVRV